MNRLDRHEIQGRKNGVEDNILFSKSFQTWSGAKYRRLWTERSLQEIIIEKKIVGYICCLKCCISLVVSSDIMQIQQCNLSFVPSGKWAYVDVRLLFLRGLDVQRFQKQKMKVLSMAIWNQGHTSKRNLYFVSVHMLHLSCYFLLGKKISCPHLNLSRHKRLVIGYNCNCKKFAIFTRISWWLIHSWWFLNDCWLQIATRMVIEYGWSPDDSPAIYITSKAVIIYLMRPKSQLCCVLVFL